MPEIYIRPAEADDINLLKGFDHSYQTRYVWQMDRQTEEAQELIYFREIQLPRPVRVVYPRTPESLFREYPDSQKALVACLQEKLVGYACFREDISPLTAWISDLVVADHIRREGIATALILSVQEWAENRGLRRVIIEMQSKNYPAIKMAQKLGLELCGYHDQYYSNKDIALFFAGGL